jgi:hypothetical protein
MYGNLVTKTHLKSGIIPVRIQIKKASIVPEVGERQPLHDKGEDDK